MRLGNAADLLGTNNLEQTTLFLPPDRLLYEDICILHITQEDGIFHVISAIFAQHKRGSKHIVIVLHGWDRVLQTSLEFEMLKNVNSKLHMRIAFVIYESPRLVHMAWLYGFVVFKSLESYLRSLRQYVSKTQDIA